MSRPCWLLARENRVERMGTLVRTPGCQAKAAPAHAGQLTGHGLLIGGENQSEARADDVERAVTERESLSIAFDPFDVGTRRARQLEQPRRDVKAGHLRARAGRAEGHFARPRRNVEPTLPRLRGEALDKGVVDLGEPSRDELVVAAAPELG